MIVFAVEEITENDYGRDFSEVVEIFSERKDAEQFIRIQDTPSNYCVSPYEVHDTVQQFTDAYILTLKRSAYQKLTPAERNALGLTEQ